MHTDSEQPLDTHFAQARKTEDTIFVAGLLKARNEDEIVEVIERLRDTLLETEGERYNAEQEAIKERVVAAHQDRDSWRDQIRDLSARQQNLLEAIDSARERFRDLNIKRGTLLTSLVSRRSEYPVKLMRRRVAEASSLAGELGEEILAQERRQLECERTLHDVVNDRKHLNREGFEWLDTMLEEKVHAAQARLGEMEAYVAFLHRTGITKKVTGFLVWAGYLSFLALGWFLGGILQRLHAENGTAADPVLRMVLAALSGLFSDLPLGWGVVAILLIPLIVLALVGGIVVGADRLLRSFDQTWKTERVRKRKARSADGFLSTWMSNPTRHIGPVDYTQLLASLPFLYVWGLIPLVVAFAMSRTTGETTDLSGSLALSGPTSSLLYTYLGVVVCILVAGAAMIYATKVTELRFRSFSSQEVGFKRLVLIHIEFVVLAAAFIVIVAFGDLWRGLVGDSSALWGARSTLGVLMLVLVGAFVVAYGMIYRGVFWQHDSAKRELQRLQAKQQKVRGVSQLDLYEEPLNRYRRELRRLHIAIDRRWASLGWTLRRRASSYWRSIRRKPEMTRSDSDLQVYDWRDQLLEPELVGELVQTDHLLTVEREVLEDLEREGEKTQSTLNDLRAVDWDQRIRALIDELAASRHKHVTRMARIRLIYLGKVVDAISAYRAGDVLKSQTGIRLIPDSPEPSSL